jgi:K+-transporting ATPase c subunit
VRKDIVGSLVAIVLLTVGFGLVYPLVMTGVAQVTFRDRANGSQLERDGKVVGSSLIGQDFRKPVLDDNGQPQTDEEGNPVLEADPNWFQSRPSQSDYSANVTFFNNLGPNQKDLADLVKANLDAYLALERPHTPTLTAAGVPVDAKVAAILRPMWPDLPMPVMISRPLDDAISATAAASGCARAPSMAAESARIPPASVSSVRSAEAISGSF